MLYAVLLLVLAALGLLVPALTSASTLWAWSSVAASAAAAVGLVLDWWLHRRSGAGAVVAQGSTQDRSGDGRGGADQAPAPPVGVPAVVPTGVAPEDEPAEEDTDAADLLAVADAPDEVRVLDERPRYHLAGCSWVGDRAALGLPLAEARELGFTPCGVCRPDSALAATKRAAAKRAERVGAAGTGAAGTGAVGAGATAVEPAPSAATPEAPTERAAAEPERAVRAPQAAEDALGAAGTGAGAAEPAGSAGGTGGPAEDEPAARS
ncbi:MULTISPECIES: hypothetical protein [Actinosynnema]|uniref:hypothetical protein n=1 Tax=Actinosynnema TaxID=40566 RepID=UPI002646C8BB|nr:hypothetical protein [Actinosynnema pretiosum]MCP2094137.1 hypothetical protein [Actinosynnema pretiosum]